MSLIPPSSVEEQSAVNREVPSSNLGAGAIPYQYVIIRDKLTGGSFLSQFGHACGESVTPAMCPLDKRTIIRIKIATKARMEQAVQDMRALKPRVTLAEVYENTGPMAGVRTCVGFIAENPDSLPASVRDLPQAQFDRISKEPQEPQP